MGSAAPSSPGETPEVELGSDEEVELEDVPADEVEVAMTATLEELDVVKAATDVSCVADGEIAGSANTADVDFDPKVEATILLEDDSAVEDTVEATILLEDDSAVEDTAVDVDDSCMAGLACREPPQFLPVGTPHPLPPATGHHSGSGSLGDQSGMGGDVVLSYLGL